MTELEALQNQVKRLAAERDRLKAELKIANELLLGTMETNRKIEKKLKAENAELRGALGNIKQLNNECWLNNSNTETNREYFVLMNQVTCLAQAALAKYGEAENVCK
ncbi:MAG: hypothetical protein KAR42_17750 [candidate division Zixibacteria bacterium]|nr:hypothetical protein [candidate division Zixibacteria bacterium]